MKNKENNKLISVGIPTYNRIDFLKQAIESVLNQSHKNYEIIISNNNSKDQTKNYLEKFKYDNRFKIFNQTKNIGIVDNWNFCLNKASGFFFIMLSDDDVLEKNALINLSKCIEKESVSFAFGGYSILKKNIKYIPNKTNDIDLNIMKGEKFIKGFLESEHVAYPSALMYKTNLAKKLNGYPKIGSSMDFGLLILLSLSYDVAYTSTVVCSYRIHTGSYSMSKNFIESYKLFWYWIKELDSINIKIKKRIMVYIKKQLTLITIKKIVRNELDDSKLPIKILNEISPSKLRNIMFYVFSLNFIKKFVELRRKINNNYA